jgi:DNA-binding transcriptional regulator YhcF (GntR family)
MNKSKKDLVIDELKRNTEGLTVIEIANVLKISRNTVAVALAELKGAELIRKLNSFLQLCILHYFY